MENPPATNARNNLNAAINRLTQHTEIKKDNPCKLKRFLFGCMAVAMIISLFFTAYFAYRTQELTQELTQIKNRQAAQQKIINENGDQSTRSTSAWSKLEQSEANNYFGIDVASFLAEPAKSLNCLNYKGEEYPSLDTSNLSSVTDDPILSQFSKQIESHQFSDEQISIENGQRNILNEGKKSSRKISYKSVCKSQGLYFFMISTSISETGLIENLRKKLGLGTFSVKAAGGWSDPSHFIYSNKDGKLAYMENFPPANSHLTLPPLSVNQDRVEEYSGLTTTGSGAYYSCSRPYVSNGSEVLIRCGGGDGPAGESGIFLVNLTTQNVKEKAFCLSNLKYSKRCFDENGKVYKEVLNEQ